MVIDDALGSSFTRLRASDRDGEGILPRGGSTESSEDMANSDEQVVSDLVSLVVDEIVEEMVCTPGVFALSERRC